MVRRGWTHLEVPNGWVQLIRGPRPKSVQWPRAHDRKPQQPQRQIGGQRQATEVPKKDSRQDGVGQAPLHPDERIARARVRVGQLESALKALDRLDPAAASLKEALKKAQFQARVPPIESRVKVAEEYLARKQKRLLEAEASVVAAIEGRDRLKAEVAKVQEEKLRLQEHPCSVPMDISPSGQSNLMVELEQLQMRVAQLQAQNEELMSCPKRQAVGSGAAPDRGSRLREDFVPACDEDVVRWMRAAPVGHAGCNNSWECPRVGETVPSCGECSGGFVTDIKSVNGRERCQGSFGSVTERHCVQVRSRYGLRGVRVGEASNPGHKKRRRRVMSSPDPSDSDFSFFDGFEQDLCSVGWDGGGTQILPTAIQSPGTTLVEESGKPTLFDMTIDDCEEVSGGVSRVRRRRLVLVPTQLESTRPTVEDTDCPQTHMDGSDTESGDGNDPQSQDEHPHSDESVVSSRMGASIAEERGSDQEAEEDDLHTSPSAIFPGRGAITAGFESLDTVDLAEIWKVRAILMKSVPKFLHGVYRFAKRQALDAVKKGHEERNEMMQIRGWKLFFSRSEIVALPSKTGRIGPQEAVGGQSGPFSER